MNLLCTYLLLIPIICQGNVVAKNIPTFWNTIEFLKEQNSMKLSSIIFLSDTYTATAQENDSIKENMFHNTYFQEETMMLHITPTNDGLDTAIIGLEQTLKMQNHSIVIVLDLEESNLIKQLINSIPRDYLQDNTWLFINPYSASITNTLHLKQSVVHPFQNKIMLDSQVYALVGNTKNASLFEIYKTCNNYPLIIKGNCKIYTS